MWKEAKGKEAELRLQGQARLCRRLHPGEGATARSWMGMARELHRRSLGWEIEGGGQGEKQRSTGREKGVEEKKELAQ